MDKLLTIGCVAAGGGLGAVLRFVLTGTMHRLVHRLTPREINPDLFLWTGTLLVNVLGCFCIGVLMTLFISRGQITPYQQRFLITGLLGSLTTFSAFGYETVELFSRENMSGMAFLNVAANLLLGFTAVWLGQLAMRYFLGQ